jgi:hypothetical protein
LRSNINQEIYKFITDFIYCIYHVICERVKDVYIENMIDEIIYYISGSFYREWRCVIVMNGKYHYPIIYQFRISIDHFHDEFYR